MTGEVVSRLLEYFGRDDAIGSDPEAATGLRLVDDLGFDSVELYELLTLLELALDRPLDEGFMLGVQTVGDVVHFLSDVADLDAVFVTSTGW